MSKVASNHLTSLADDHFNREDWAGAYTNVEKELNHVLLHLKSGSVPKELSGKLYRNGPGRLERGGQWVHHPFDGDGMISAIHFKNGEVRFTNRFIRTKGWEEEEKEGRFTYRGVFGTQKDGGLFKNAFDMRLKNIANTNVIKLGDQLLALWEAAGPHALDPISLETYGLSTVNGALEENEAFSAHPRFDPGHHGCSRMVTFGVKTGPNSTIRLMEFGTEGNEAGKLISDRKDQFTGFAFLHDFAITPNWAIFLQNAIKFNPLPFIFGQKGAAQCLSTKANGQAKFWLIPRDSGLFANKPPRIIDAPDGFVFHHLNAQESEKEITINSIYYKDFPTIGPDDNFRKINFDLIPEGILKECRINLDKNEISTTQLSGQCCEFGTINPKQEGITARFSWMATAERKTGNGPLQAIKKLDLLNGEEFLWSAAPRGFVSEPKMIPNPNIDIEDCGWVVFFVWNSERHGTDLVILKAHDLSEQAKLELPISIPYGLHGSWVPE